MTCSPYRNTKNKNNTLTPNRLNEVPNIKHIEHCETEFRNPWFFGDEEPKGVNWARCNLAQEGEMYRGFLYIFFDSSCNVYLFLL